MWRGISLANKCQILFGAAVVLIISAALVFPAFRLSSLVDRSQLETSRQIARLWASSIELRSTITRRYLGAELGSDATESDLTVNFWPLPSWETDELRAPFLLEARRRFASVKDAHEPVIEYAAAEWDRGDRVYRYARLIEASPGSAPGVIYVERRSTTAANELLVNRAYLFLAGLVAGVLAIVVFYLITMRIILSPVRALRDTAQTVRKGELHVRADIHTGDEFEQLADAFNSMLAELADRQSQLRAINTSLDLKLTELSERNTSLYEAARVKGEFLASISHELRTPLNSIIGFAEILLDVARTEEERGGDPTTIVKRRRYLDNILNAGRSLLEMINELLAMAKIEAGKVELHVQTMNVAATCDGLLALIRPLADRKSIRLTLQLQSDRPPAGGASSTGGSFVSDPAAAALPIIETDPQKFQQILFNFLSNAVKFTPDKGEVTLRAEKLVTADGGSRVRVSVLDTGPGIPHDLQQTIFEKFVQLEAGHTRQQGGTGLGLAIAREYADLLQGEIHLVSDLGRGSMFSLVVPMKLDPARTAARRSDASRASVAPASV
ncbi:MAG TPA: HAMP domain-containing sensor histidine kinase [Phycisphaerales bacterium]|nr:HAMP domain-containing sensor histidine kinase [Phycisphaerales bacterium]